MATVLLALDAVPLPLAGAVLVPDAGAALPLTELPWTSPRPPPRPPLVLTRFQEDLVFLHAEKLLWREVSYQVCPGS